GGTGGRTKRPCQFTHCPAQRVQPPHTGIQMALNVLHNHDGIVDQYAQRDHHTNHGNLVQHTATEVVKANADQGHHGQDGCHQEPHSDTHACEHHCHYDQHREHQTPRQVV